MLDNLNYNYEKVYDNVLITITKKYMILLDEILCTIRWKARFNNS